MTLTVIKEELALTDECLHYDHIDQVPPDLKKYYHQRNSLFSLYEEYDIRLTHDAWFGVTPEPVANQIAQDLLARKGTIDRISNVDTIIDLFAGAGGNTIAFARSIRNYPQSFIPYMHVIAIEKDLATLTCAQNNAYQYGVDDAITFVHGDSLEFLHLLKTAPEKLPEELRSDLCSTVLFASPPWGGVDYGEQEIFDLSTMKPYNLEVLYAACWPMETIFYLPRTSDLRQLARLMGEKKKEELEEEDKMEGVQYCMAGASKAMVAYVPQGKGIVGNKGCRKSCICRENLT